ncbi:winged helix-turn-helix transcriptional regulator [Streptoalloteichus hindustanus]|uniref:winged helix-turn-helix transcriptional regulator n=1 Tax=Streptoalloteichus hindustanus TaxID=2017 RepID=UPI001F40394D|nr:helix-turn-helix domain-containing protein [Streptoalloteichus hindustanus]
MSNVFHRDCPARMVLDHVGSRWGVLILTALRERSHRFSELHATIDGISEKMLSQTLTTMRRDGLVTRHVDPAVPPKVHYELTDFGRGLAEHMHNLVRWIGANAEHVVTAQQKYDAQEPPARQ